MVGNPVPMAGLTVPVETVVGDVQFPPDKPLSEWCLGPVKYLLPRFEPIELLSLFFPEAKPIGSGMFVKRLIRDQGIAYKGLRRRESSTLIEECFDRLVHSELVLS